MEVKPYISLGAGLKTMAVQSEISVYSDENYPYIALGGHQSWRSYDLDSRAGLIFQTENFSLRPYYSFGYSFNQDPYIFFNEHEDGFSPLVEGEFAFKAHQIGNMATLDYFTKGVYVGLDTSLGYSEFQNWSRAYATHNDENEILAFEYWSYPCFSYNLGLALGKKFEDTFFAEVGFEFSGLRLISDEESYKGTEIGLVARGGLLFPAILKR